MEFTEEDKKLYQQLAKEPLSLWIIIAGYIVFLIAFNAAKHYLGWSWLGQLYLELPTFLLFISIAGRSAITDSHRILLNKLSSLHPELTQSECENNIARVDT